MTFAEGVNQPIVDFLPSQRDSPMSAQATGLGFGRKCKREPQRGDPKPPYVSFGAFHGWNPFIDGDVAVRGLGPPRWGFVLLCGVATQAVGLG